jgi:calcineurin-like phosphoesterase family protein
LLAILGDIHFSSSKDYFVATAEAFLAWFKTWDKNNEDNELLLLGDLVHSSVNGGVVVEFVERLWIYSQFNRIHIIPGNHDVKRRDGLDQLAYEFLRHKDDVTIYDRITSVEIQGMNVLMMPHYIPLPGEPPMLEYYSRAHELFPDEYDLVVGHFMEESLAFGTSDAVFNLGKLNASHICLGHLHTRSNPEIYVGSVYPNRTNENDSSRAAILFEAGRRFEEPLPVFCEFLTVQHPEPLPETKALVPIYTITNVASEKLAKLRYGDIFIRKVVQGMSIPGKSEMTLGRSEFAQALNVSELFNGFMRAQEPPMERRVASICLSSLKDTTNLEYGSRNPRETVLQT